MVTATVNHHMKNCSWVIMLTKYNLLMGVEYLEEVKEIGENAYFTTLISREPRHMVGFDVAGASIPKDCARSTELSLTATWAI